MKAPQSGYPLQWPTGKARTPQARRKGGNFRAGRSGLSMADAAKRVRRELDKITGAFLPVLSTNVELRLDGFPRDRMKYAHPDTGGNETVAAKLNAAIAAARRHWGNA